MRYLIGFVTSIMCILGNIHAANQSIHHCESIDEVLPFLSNVSPQSMVVFDLDDTLITKSDRVLRPAGNDLKIYYYFRLIQRYRFDHLLYLISLVEQAARPELVVDAWPSIIASLQQTTPWVIAHTAAPPKQLGIFDSFPEQRRQLLNQFNIDFSSVAETMPDVELVELNHIPYITPVFYSGMLFSDNYSKGESLAALLKRYSVKPDLVVFIDDTHNNLRSVEKELGKLGIPFIGIHFEEKKLFSEKVDERLAEVQFHYIVEKQQWVNDDEAREILERDGPAENDDLAEPPSDDPITQEDDTEEIWSF